MRTREEIEKDAIAVAGSNLQFISFIEILLDLRDQNERIIELLSVRNSRKMVMKEVPLTDREREVLDGVKEE